MSKMSKEFGKGELYDKFLRSVGEIVVEYAKGEHAMSMCVDSLTNSRKGSKIFENKKYGAEQKIKEFTKLIVQLEDDSLALTCFVLLDELENCRVTRNDFAHSIWQHFPTKDSVMIKLTYDRSKGISIGLFEIDEAVRVLQTVKKMTEEIIWLFAQITIKK